MTAVVIIGGGVAGLCGAMLLARDGHQVTVLERDPAPPPPPRVAWAEWERRGVTQFHLPHLFMARFREVLDAELPEVVPALEADGALRTNRIATLPPELTGGTRPGDERFAQITGRRPMVEATLARLAAAEPGIEVRRGVAVRGLLRDEHGHDGIPHIVGVVTDAGDEVHADLVVDAGGRRSALPDLLEAVGARRPVEEIADCGFVYYGRHYRSADGSMPAMFGAPLQHYDSLSLLTLPADNGHWSVGVTTSADDVLLRRARDVDVWERIVGSYPLIAHWIDAEPTTGIDVMAKIDDRVRRFDIDGEPVATGIVAVGDAAACTNPSVGRGASIALLHVVCLRDVLRTAGLDDPRVFMSCWQETARATVEPFVGDTLAFDRHRLAEMNAQICGRTYQTEDPAWGFAKALVAGASQDPDLLRAALSVAGLLARGIELLAQPGILEKALAVDLAARPPGPNRDELMSIIGAAS